MTKYKEFRDLMTLKGPDPEINLCLTKIKTFLDLLGKPQNKIKLVIHIAGTNGKGSTLAFLEALFQQNNFKIGKYTSPHLISWHERFQINGQAISAERFEELWLKISQGKGFSELTYFEKLTALAFEYFALEKVDILLLETGLGGRLDATNMVDKPTLCLITNIDFDHQEYLGNTLEKIATEKAGILKNKVPYLSTVKQANLQKVIEEVAAEKEATKLNLKPEILEKIKNLELGLKGFHQANNAYLAVQAYLHLAENYPILNLENNWAYIENTICKPINWPGRFEQVTYNQNHKQKSFIIDGAHNIAGAKSLRESLQIYSQSEIWLLGFLKNKDYAGFLTELFKTNSMDKIKYIIFTNAAETDKSADLNQLKTLATKLGLPENTIQLEGSPEKAFDLFINLQNDHNIGVISGSLYLIGQILKLMD